MSHPDQASLHKAEWFAGFAVGLQVLIKALDKAGSFSKHPFSVGFLFFAAAFIVLGSLFHQRLAKVVKHAHALFHQVEGVVLIICAVLTYEKGSVRIPLFLGFLGLLYLAVGSFQHWVRPESRQRAALIFLRCLGVACILFAGTALVVTLRVGHSVWAYGLGAAFLVAGVVLAFFTRSLMASIDRKLGNSGAH